MEAEAQAMTYWETEDSFLWVELFTTPQARLIKLTPLGVDSNIGMMDHRSLGLAFNLHELSEPPPDLITVDGGGGRAYQGPTIGLDNNGKLIVICGVAFDGTCFDMTSLFHYEIKMYEMMSGTHTISITTYCAQGVNNCNYVGIGIMPYSEDMNNPTWKIEVHKDHLGNLIPVIFDPERFLGEVTVTTQIVDGKFLLVSFTIEFKNKDTGPMKFAVEVRDVKRGAQTTYLNEGVWIKDADAYPYIETAFEKPLRN